MLLENKTAIIYGAGGAIGGAIARIFAREGAKVFLSGRTLSKVESVAEEIVAAGGTAEAFLVDALDEAAVEGHVAKVFEATGRLDVSFNAITAVPQPGTQGIPIAQLSVDAFIAPIILYMRSHFLTARAAARRMAEQGSGVLLMNTPEPARLGLTRVGGMGPAWAAHGGLEPEPLRGIRRQQRPRNLHSVVRHAGDRDDRCRLRSPCRRHGHLPRAVPSLRRKPDASEALDQGL